MSDCCEQADEHWISGAEKSRSIWLIFGNFEVNAIALTGIWGKWKVGNGRKEGEIG